MLFDALPPGIFLRPIAPADAEFLCAVYASTRQEELAEVPWTDEQKSAFLRSQFAAQHHHYQTHYPGASFQIVLKNELPVGRLYIDQWEREIRIVDIALLPEHRRIGIGSALLKLIQAHAARLQKPVSIHVEQFNPALSLYQRLGFAKRADGPGPYVLMEWRPAVN